MESVNDLLDYIEAGQSADWLSAVAQRIGRRQLRVVVIQVLCWLKSQNYLRKKRPLELNMAYPWCGDLAEWLAPEHHMASTFEVSKGVFDFREDVEEHMRDQIRADVDKRYNPPLRRR